MIIEADFLNHWKIQALANAVGEAAAYKALIALWGHCQTRRAWEFQISPEMLAGICKFSGSAAKLWESMLSLKLIDPAAENGWFQVHQWGETNISLVARWAGGMHLKSHDYPARGLHHRTTDQAKQPANPTAKLLPLAASIDTTHAAAIGLDGIGEDRIPPVVPQGGQKPADTAAFNPDSIKVDSDTSETGVSAGKKKKKAGRVVESLTWPDGWTGKRREVMEDWLRYKSEKGQRYKPTGFAALLRKLDGLPVERLRAVVDASMAANYSGLFPEKQESAGAIVPRFQPRGALDVTTAFPVATPVNGAPPATPSGYARAWSAIMGEDRTVPPWPAIDEAMQGRIRQWLEDEKQNLTPTKTT